MQLDVTNVENFSDYIKIIVLVMLPGATISVKLHVDVSKEHLSIAIKVSKGAQIRNR